MNREQLVAEIAARASMTKTAAARALDATITTIGAALKRGEDVSLVGFAHFSVRERPERQGRNPGTGETITVPAAKIPVFKAGQKLRDALNKE
jgi:DNA-binding protein HU-beta